MQDRPSRRELLAACASGASGAAIACAGAAGPPADAPAAFFLVGDTHYLADKPAKAGIPVFNVDNSSHFASKEQAFFYFEIGGGAVTAREYQTKDAWKTGSWSPRSWSAPVAAPHG